jgi:hypothetical protein
MILLVTLQNLVAFYAGRDLRALQNHATKHMYVFFLFFPSFTQTLLSDIDFASEIGKLTSLLHIASTKKKTPKTKKGGTFTKVCVADDAYSWVGSPMLQLRYKMRKIQ